MNKYEKTFDSFLLADHDECYVGAAGSQTHYHF